MSLSNIPDWKLIKAGNEVEEMITNWFRDDLLIDQELDLRNPEQAAWYFGDCDGQIVFIPSEPEYDSEGQLIASEVVGYNEGNEIWTQM